MIKMITMVFKKKQWRRISSSQFAARLSREVEVEGILASRFSQSEQLDGMFVCAVTGHGKVWCFCNISKAFSSTSNSLPVGVAIVSVFHLRPTLGL